MGNRDIGAARLWGRVAVTMTVTPRRNRGTIQGRGSGAATREKGRALPLRLTESSVTLESQREVLATNPMGHMPTRIDIDKHYGITHRADDNALSYPVFFIPKKGGLCRGNHYRKNAISQKWQRHA